MPVEHKVVLGSPLLLAVAAGVWLVSCGALSSRSSGPAAETLPALASADPLAAGPVLILEANNGGPAPLAGIWKVATGDRDCSIELRIDDAEVTGQVDGCSDPVDQRPIAIGMVSGSSFLFQTDGGDEGSIWSGRYDPTTQTLQGRRENLVTGKLESFVARR